MALIFCEHCGNHDCCPEEFGGDPTCDMCGRPGLRPCGECSACRDKYDDDDECGDQYGDEDDYDDD